MYVLPWRTISVLIRERLNSSSLEYIHYSLYTWSCYIQAVLYLLVTEMHDLCLRGFMITSSTGNIVDVTDPLCGNSPVTAEFPSQGLVTRSFDFFFDLRLSRRLSKQSWGWWFEMPSRSLWHHCNVMLRGKKKHPPVWLDCNACPDIICFGTPTGRKVFCKNKKRCHSVAFLM